MSDILSAASLILAIITTMFGLVYPTVSEILQIKPATHKLDNTSAYNKAINVRNSRLWPLLISSLVLTLVFLPEFLRQITISLRIIKSVGLRFQDYDTVMAAFVAVFIFMFSLCVVIILLNRNLNEQIKKLNPA